MLLPRMLSGGTVMFWQISSLGSNISLICHAQRSVTFSTVMLNVNVSPWVMVVVWGIILRSVVVVEEYALNVGFMRMRSEIRINIPLLIISFLLIIVIFISPSLMGLLS